MNIQNWFLCEDISLQQLGCEDLFMISSIQTKLKKKNIYLPSHKSHDKRFIATSKFVKCQHHCTIGMARFIEAVYALCNILILHNLATGTQHFYAFLNYRLFLRVSYFGYYIQKRLSKQILKEPALN